MTRFPALLIAFLACFVASDARPNANVEANGFPNTAQVRLWYLHPPVELKLKAEAGQARYRKCAGCPENGVTALTLRATAYHVQIEGDKSASTEIRVTGVYQLTQGSSPAITADFPVTIHAGDGKLLVTAAMPMDEYVAGVLAGETGAFKSDETLKAMAVTARTYAMHFGRRHAIDGFDFCDSTHCQNLRLADISPRLRKIINSTAGEVLWYDGEPAATYYHANCGGTTEDGRYILGNDEQRSPYLKQHSDAYCVRNGTNQWQSEVSLPELQRAHSPPRAST